MCHVSLGNDAACIHTKHTGIHGSASFCDVIGWWDRLIGFKQRIGYMAQGEQRVLDKAGRVYPYKDPSQHIMVILRALSLSCLQWQHRLGCPVCIYSHTLSNNSVECDEYRGPIQLRKLESIISLLHGFACSVGRFSFVSYCALLGGVATSCSQHCDLVSSDHHNVVCGIQGPNAICATSLMAQTLLSRRCLASCTDLQDTAYLYTRLKPHVACGRLGQR